MTMQPPTLEEVAAALERLGTLRAGLESVLFDQTQVVEQVMVAVLARGHVLLEGLPGLGKTQLCRSLSYLLALSHRRIQFTPDLLPGDITGTHVVSPDGRGLAFREGPLFASVVLADEINRASPKTQSALLEAMQERNVTVLGEIHALPNPFFVLATQNPIELEGTYPLPEAQLDRFLFRIRIAQPGAATLRRLLEQRPRGEPPPLSAVVDAEGLASLWGAVDRVLLPPAVADYVARLVEASHPGAPAALETVERAVRYGASPRAALALATAGRALALMRGKPNVGFDEVRALAHPVMEHRLSLSYAAELEGLGAEAVVAALLREVAEAPGD